MKILVIHHSGLLGGGTLSCFDIINFLKKNGHNVLLSLPLGNNAARQKAKEEKINVLDDNICPICFGYYNGGANILKVIIRYLLSIKYRKKWDVILKREKPDIVVLNSIIQWPMIPILNKNNIKNICFVRETMRGSRKNIINKIIAMNLEKSSAISYLSQYDMEEWKLDNKIIQRIIPDSVNIEEFKKNINKNDAKKALSLKKDAKYILYVGGMYKLKGAKTIIRAINEIKDEDFKLLFLGDLGSELIKSNGINRIRFNSRIKFIKQLHKYIVKNELDNKIIFIGIKEDMRYWYAASDFVVFPAENAHQARPIYESGVFKSPAIVSDFPNYYEYLHPEISGLVFEPNNYKELAQSIKRLLRDEKLCLNLGQNNYLLTEKYHDNKKISKLVSNLVNEININKKII